jgi:hypothetical protein
MEKRKGIGFRVSGIGGKGMDNGKKGRKAEF